jgi:glycosyltransferase involved in cell wall biosynthesis
MIVSVIIPTYKPDNYLFDCLLSLKNQTLQHDLFEIIIVLNGCKDPYQNQIETFINKNILNDIKSTLIQNDIANVSIARNIGINASEGEFIAFIDDDDIVSNDYLELLLAVSNNNSIGVADVKVFTKNLLNLTEDYISKCFHKNINLSPTSVFKLRSFLSSSCAKLISKEIIKHRRFDDRFTIGEDSLFMFTISDEIKEIRLVNTFYYRRNRPTSASQTPKTMKFRIFNTLALLKSFSLIYVKNAFKYRFLLYLSRLVAVILNI